MWVAAFGLAFAGAYFGRTLRTRLRPVNAETLDAG